jgi:hypothetical protein
VPDQRRLSRAEEPGDDRHRHFGEPAAHSAASRA